MKERIITTIVAGACALSTACAAPVDSDEDGSELDSAQQELISRRAGLSRAMRVTPGDHTSESEAVITITADTSDQYHTVITANADDPGFIFFDDGGTPDFIRDDTRTINMGSSQMRIWHRLGLSGAYTETRMVPPDGGALWGDPAIASYGKWVYATTLHIPRGLFPSNGADHIPIETWGGLCNDNEVDHCSVEPYLGGACVARSSNYGQSFSMTLADCVTDNGHFYDGTAVVATYQGKIFAAFNDVDDSQVDVWRTDSSTGALYQTPDPFPGKDIASHARLKVLGTSAPVLMAADANGTLWMSRYANRKWTTAVQVTTNVAVHQTITMGNLVKIRQANGFDFSLYTAPDGSGMHMPFVAMRMSAGGKAVLSAGECSAASGAWVCGENPNWASDPSINCFSPTIETAYYGNGPHAPSTPLTMISYHRELSTGTKVALYATSLRSYTTKALTGWQAPCPDLRGYWGDYDSMAAAPDGFHRVFSDSTDLATCTRTGYGQHPLGVSEMTIPVF